MLVLRVKLTTKFFLAFVLATLVVFAASAYLRARSEIAHFEDDMQRDAGALASSLAEAVSVVSVASGEAEAAAFLQRAARQAPHMTVRWVTLDDGDDSGFEHPIAAPEVLVGLERGAPRFAAEAVGQTDPGALLAYARVDPTVVVPGPTAIEIRESLVVRDRFVAGSYERAAYTMLIALGTSATLALLLGVVLIGRPLAAIVGKVRRIAAGELWPPLVLHQRDEVGEVAAELNAMCDRLARSRAELEAETSARISAIEQLRRAERLATVGRLAAGIAHEIGTPLAVAAGRSTMIMEGEVTGDEVAVNARIVVEQTQRIARIIRQLLDFARSSPAQRGRVELGGLARRIVALLEPLADKRRVSLAMQGPTQPAANGDVDAAQIEQVLTNVVMNAIQATDAGGEVRVAVTRGHVVAPADCGGAEGEFVAIEVSDSGSGMDADTLAHAFEPFFTTKDVGEGTGLGLPVAHGLVREHGGWIDATSVVGKGSRFVIHLPVAAEQAA